MYTYGFTLLNSRNKHNIVKQLWGFPGGGRGKKTTRQCRRHKLGFHPWAGKIPEGGHGDHSHILAWRIPWTEETAGLRSIGSQGVRHD